MRGSLTSGNFEVLEKAARRSRIDQAEDVAKIIQGVGLGLVVPPPVQPFIAKLIELGAAALRVASDAAPARERDGARDPVTRLLVAAAAERPLVLLIEGMDSQGAAWFSQLLADEWADDVATDVRAFFVLTLDGPQYAPPPASSLPPALAAAARLASNTQASWRSLAPLRLDDVRDWLGPAPESLVHHLWQASGGVPSLIESVWSDWISEKVVVVTHGEPRFSSDADERSARSARTRAIERLRMRQPLATAEVDVVLALKIAALQGEVFTADAIAQVLGFDNRTELVDAFNVLTGSDAAPVPILDEVEHHTIVSPGEGRQHLCRYRFTSSMLWLGLRTRGMAPEQRRKYAGDLVVALQECYGSQTHLVAGCLAVLHALAGDSRSSVAWQRIHEEGEGAELWRWRAHLVLAADHASWNPEQCRDGIDLLFGAFERLMATVAIAELTEYAQVALNLASRTDSLTAEAQSAWMNGVVANRTGDPARAVRYGRIAFEAWKAIPQPRRAGAAAAALAAHLTRLRAESAEQARPRLLAEIMECLEFARDEGDSGIAGNALIQMSLFTSNPVQIRRLLEEALAVLPADGTGPAGRVRAWDRFAHLELESGQFTRARDLLARAQAEAETHNLTDLLWGELLLRGAVDLAAGDFNSAGDFFRKSHHLASLLGHHGAEYKSLLGLAVAERFMARHGEAARVLAMAEAVQPAGTDVQVGALRVALDAIDEARAAGAVGPVVAEDPRSLQRQYASLLDTMR